MPAALDVDWLNIEKAAIAGMTYTQLSQAYGVPETAIRKRASRYHWPIPARIQAMIAARHPVSPSPVELSQIEQNVALSQTIVTSAADTHAKTALGLVNAAAAALGTFAAAPAPITDWQGASVAYKVQRLAAGIDKEGAEIKVNVAMFAEQFRADEQPDTWADVSAPVIISTQAPDTEQGE